MHVRRLAPLALALTVLSGCAPKVALRGAAELPALHTPATALTRSADDSVWLVRLEDERLVLDGQRLSVITRFDAGPGEDTLSADGDALVVKRPAGLTLWTGLRSGGLWRAELSQHRVYDVAFSPDGRWLSWIDEAPEPMSMPRLRARMLGGASSAPVELDLELGDDASVYLLQPGPEDTVTVYSEIVSSSGCIVRHRGVVETYQLSTGERLAHAFGIAAHTILYSGTRSRDGHLFAFVEGAYGHESLELHDGAAHLYTHDFPERGEEAVLALAGRRGDATVITEGHLMRVTAEGGRITALPLATLDRVALDDAGRAALIEAGGEVHLWRDGRGLLGCAPALSGARDFDLADDGRVLWIDAQGALHTSSLSELERRVTPRCAQPRSM